MKVRPSLGSIAMFFAVAASLLFYLVAERAPAQEDTYPNAQLLVETDWVARNLDDPAVRLVDVRPVSEYAVAHIRNAVNIDVKAALTVTVDGVKGMVAPKERVEEVLRGAGIDNETRVVAYDGSGGLWAARLFWILDYYGHRNVSLVNGGLVKWAAEGKEVTQAVPSLKGGRFTATPDTSKLATMSWIEERLGKKGVVLLDARTHDEYIGKDVRSARGGHIPGAVHLEWAKTISAEQKTFLPYKELRNLVYLTGAKKSDEVVTYCQTGVRGAQLYFVLKLLGYENVRLYDGSWEEWGNKETTKVSTELEKEHKTC